MMITQGDQRIWLQGGQLMDESGQVLDPDTLPDWFKGEYEKLTERMKATHPTDGSEPAAPKDSLRRSRIDELRKELALLEEQDINSSVGARVGEGEGRTDQGSGVPLRRPVDETDEEALHGMTKQEIFNISQDEELDGIDMKMTKAEMIAAVVEARGAKANVDNRGTGEGRTGE
jgi:hypothetical protein